MRGTTHTQTRTDTHRDTRTDLHTQTHIHTIRKLASILGVDVLFMERGRISIRTFTHPFIHMSLHMYFYPYVRPGRC